MTPVRALVVDDSGIYRRVVGQALEGLAGVNVVGYAADGRAALDFLAKETVDLVTLDLEMPRLDGLSTLKAMRQLSRKSRVLVLSATTAAAAQSTIAAMAAGADDFVTKPSEADPAIRPSERLRALLLPKIKQFYSWVGNDQETARMATPPVAPRPVTHNLLLPFAPQLVVIASSTGGPAALERLFAAMKAAPLHCPVLIAQHMPALFTASLASHLRAISQRSVEEARHQQILRPGHIYVAPGDFHLKVGRQGERDLCALLDQAPRRNSVRPCADFLFESAAALTKARTLGVVLTGMGSDGKDGAVAIKRAGGRVLTQDQASCVVFGMPKAVVEAQASDQESDLAGLAQALSNLQAPSGRS